MTDLGDGSQSREGSNLGRKTAIDIHGALGEHDHGTCRYSMFQHISDELECIDVLDVALQSLEIR